eukprot:TCONS_00000214-protein
MLSTVLNKGILVSTLHASNQKQLLKPSELDIYYEPEPTIPAERPSPTPEFLYEYIHVGRESLTNVFSGLLTTHEKISDFYATTKERISSSYNRTLEDPYFLFSPAAIVAATATGAVVAGKGRRPIKRSLYGLLFGTTAAAISYPERTLDIAETSYYHTASSIAQLFAPSAPTTTERVVEILDDKNEPDEVVESEIVISEAVTSTEEEEVSAPATEVVEEIISVIEDETQPPPPPPLQEEIVTELTEVVESEGGSAEVVPDSVNDNVSNERSEEIVGEENTEVPVSNNEVQDFDPGQTELQEISVVSLDDEKVVDDKDTRLDLDTAANQENIIIEGDLGQSDPEDSDMYSTRS